MRDEDLAVGIDLGTTNTVLAILDEGASEPRVVETRHGQPQLPSIVGVQRPRGKRKAAPPPAEIVVGTDAQKNMETAPPEDSIYSVKRLMGRSFDDANVADVRGRVGYKIVRPKDGTGASVKVVLDGKERSPVEISELILRKIKEDAEYTLSGKLAGKKIQYAVITVPTYFSADQRQATRDAGIAAGLTVMRILDEPIAAAYDYKLPVDGMDTKTILVFDFGGGTFDVSILSGQASQFVVMGRGGDMWLGGDDLDGALETALIDQLVDPDGDYGFDPRSNPKAMGRLRREVREAKESLVSRSSAEISLGDDVKDENGETIRLSVSRAMLERVIAPLVYSFRVCRSKDEAHRDGVAGMIDVAPPFAKDKESVHWTRLHLPQEQSCATCRASLADAPVREGKTRAHVNATLAAETMKRSFVDYVIMAGNSTRAPLVQRAMEEDFGAPKIMRVANPKHSVALGAAKVAASMRHLVCDNGHVSEFGALTCSESQCGARLGAPSALPPPPSVTSSFYYGVDWPGRAFAAFVAKGDVCPTPADAIEERGFPTRVTNQRMLTLPIFARDQLEKPTYNESQYKGLVVLPRGLADKTSVLLKLWLDGSATLQLSASLGKNKPLKPFRLEGGAESKLIEELESLGKRMAELLPLLRDRMKALLSEIDDIFDLALVGPENFAKAAARAADLATRIMAPGSGGSAADGQQIAMSFVRFVQEIVLGLEFLFPEHFKVLFAEVARAIVSAVRERRDPLPAVLAVIKAASEDLHGFVVKAVAEAREEGQTPPPDILTVLMVLISLIPPPVRKIIDAQIAIEGMRDDRPADAQNLSDDLRGQLSKLRRQEPGADEGMAEVVRKVLNESEQSGSEVKCPQGHVVLVRYCVGPDKWDSWGAGEGGSVRRSR